VFQAEISQYSGQAAWSGTLTMPANSVVTITGYGGAYAGGCCGYPGWGEVRGPYYATNTYGLARYPTP
jgi:uncharacterized membrane protein YhdT